MFTDRWQPGWQDCYHAWLVHAHQHSGSDATVTNYTYVTRRFFEALGKEPQLVTRAEVENWLGSPLVLRERGASPAARTRNSRHTAISSFYRYANTYEYIDSKGVPQPLTDRNPAQGIKAARTSVVHRSMTMDEFSRFMAAIPQDGNIRHVRDRAIFLTLWWTCRRREEVASLLYGNLRTTRFVDPKTQQSRDGWTYTVKIKGGEIYTAEMPSPAAESIAAYIAASGRHMEDESPIFIGYPAHEWPPVDPWRTLTGNTVWLRMRLYLCAAGLDPTRYSVHSLRRSGALARYQAGSGPLEIMHTLNHKSLSVTLRYVNALDVSQDTGALLLLEKFGQP